MPDGDATATCKSFPEHPEDCDTINIVRRVFGAISLISCLFVIFVIWVFGRYSVFTQRLILSLSIAAMLNGLGRIFQDSKNESGPWCTFQAFWLSYFNYAVMLWVCCITFNLFMNCVKNTVTTRFEWWYHGVCWLLSLGVSLLPFIGNHYGPSGSWCWIINDSHWQMGTWYIPLFVVIIALIIIYGCIIITLHRQSSNWAGTYAPETIRIQEALKTDIKQLRFYPFIFLLLSIFPLVNRIQNAVSDDHVFALALMHSMTSSLQGAAYSLVFAIDRQTLRSLTPINIKLAIRRKWAAPVVVREYTVGRAGPPEGSVGPAITEQQTGHVVVQEQEDVVVAPAEVSAEPAKT